MPGLCAARSRCRLRLTHRAFVRERCGTRMLAHASSCQSAASSRFPESDSGSRASGDATGGDSQGGRRQSFRGLPMGLGAVGTRLSDRGDAAVVSGIRAARCVEAARPGAVPGILSHAAADSTATTHVVLDPAVGSAARSGAGIRSVLPQMPAPRTAHQGNRRCARPRTPRQRGALLQPCQRVAVLPGLR